MDFTLFCFGRLEGGRQVGDENRGKYGGLLLKKIRRGRGKGPRLVIGTNLPKT
jgi:hypothetical protein